MDDHAIGVLDDSTLRHEPAVLQLVHTIQVDPPYAYRAGEVPPATEWFPSLVDRAELGFVAWDGGTPLGYCVALWLEAYGKLAGFTDRLGVDPPTTMYIAELGVGPAARRRGIATALLGRVHDAVPDDTNACLVRTLAGNDPAVALYEAHGYRIVDSVTQDWRGRARVFLVRHRSVSPPAKGQETSR